MGFVLDFHPLLGFDRLVQAIAPAATRHHPPSEFIHNHHFPGPHDVVHISQVEFLGLQGVEDVVGPGIFRIKQIRNPQHLLGGDEALITHDHVAGFFVHFVVVIAHQLPHQFIGGQIFFGGAIDLARNDQRGAGLVNQHRIHFVNHAIVKGPLHHFVDGGGHVVAQIIKP